MSTQTSPSSPQTTSHPKSELEDFDGKISIARAFPYGLQHVLAMFVANLAPIAIIASAAGFDDAYISASSDLDEYLIESLKAQGCKITSWGVGTNMITSRDCPAFGGVYKLAAVKDADSTEFTPKIKLSENTEKVTNPGNKTVYRLYLSLIHI